MKPSPLRWFWKNLSSLILAFVLAVIVWAVRMTMFLLSSRFWPGGTLRFVSLPAASRSVVPLRARVITERSGDESPAWTV